MNNVASHELPRRAEVESLARRFHGLLTARNLHIKKETPERRLARIAKAEAEYPEAASKLSWMLLGPVLDQLDAKRLLVVPEGILQYIPFGALPAPGPGIGEAQAAARVPLMLEHEIVSLPSASTLAVLRREMVGRKSAPGMLAVLADPVFDGEDPRVRKTGTGNRVASGHVPSQGPVKVERAVERAARESGVTQTGLPFPRLMFSRREAQWILGQAPAESRLQALGFAANRSTATSAALGQYRIVHIASHGIANSVHPELSGIVLSLVDERGRAQDGFLRLHEIYNLKLPAELVVLSSCQTALGKEIKGEGLVGLTRGFMYAGAERVIASLWQVDDEATATLMRHFYKAMLAEGMRPAEALRSAQMAIWKQRRWKSPYYWAAFILQGEYR
jgi:CHAT domain-containing protein